jgi:hypothetical protein
MELRDKKLSMKPNEYNLFRKKQEMINKLNVSWIIKSKIKSYLKYPCHPTSNIIKKFIKKRRIAGSIMDNTLLHPTLPIRKIVLGIKYSSLFNQAYENGDYTKYWFSMYDDFHNLLDIYNNGYTFSKSYRRVTYDIYNIMSEYEEMSYHLIPRNDFEEIVRNMENN